MIAQLILDYELNPFFYKLAGFGVLCLGILPLEEEDNLVRCQVLTDRMVIATNELTSLALIHLVQSLIIIAFDKLDGLL